ncbi:MAG: hypothetical protein WC457_00185 [Patescibacteria group bacterium]
MLKYGSEAPRLDRAEKPLEKKTSVPPPIPEAARVTSIQKAREARNLKLVEKDGVDLANARKKLESIQVGEISEKTLHSLDNALNPWEGEEDEKVA